MQGDELYLTTSGERVEVVCWGVLAENSLWNSAERPPPVIPYDRAEGRTASPRFPAVVVPNGWSVRTEDAACVWLCQCKAQKSAMRFRVSCYDKRTRQLFHAACADSPREAVQLARTMDAIVAMNGEGKRPCRVPNAARLFALTYETTQLAMYYRCERTAAFEDTPAGERWLALMKDLVALTPTLPPPPRLQRSSRYLG